MWTEFGRRAPSDQRRHGDPFPLPRLTEPSLADSLTRRLDGVLRSLNSLAAADFSMTANKDLSLTRVQLWMLEDLLRRVTNYGPELKFREDEALADLLCNANLYGQEATTVASFNADEIKILGRQLKPTPASDLAPPEVCQYLEGFSNMVERSPEELETLRLSRDLVEPHWDIKLKQSRQARFELYSRLFKCGLLTYRRRQKARVGMFAVVKKGNKAGNSQRLIVDCRQANAMMRKPPSTRLATAAGLTCMDFSEDALTDNGFDMTGQDVPSPGMETGDVGDCFYNFSVPRACSWFSTGDTVTRAEMRQWGMEVDSIFDDDSCCQTPLLEKETVYVCFGGMPMGWSWALWMANEIICHQALLAVDGSPLELVRDKRVAPPIRPSEPPIGVYVDNVHTFGGKTGEAGSRMQQIAQRFEDLGIPFEVDYVDGATTLDTLGLTFDFSDGVRVRSKRERAWRLWYATKCLLRRRRVNGDVIRVWLGHVNFHFLLSRPLLSTLSACYRFAISHTGHRFPIWPSVRKEMKTVLGLIFAVEKNLSAPVNPEVHIGDASDCGFGLMKTCSTPFRVLKEIKYQERWRFEEVEDDGLVSPCGGGPEMDGDDNETFDGHLAGAGVGPDTRYGQMIHQKLMEKCTDKRLKVKKQRLFGKAPDRPHHLREIRGIPDISDHWSDATQWTLVANDRWFDVHEHINLKEAKVCLMSLRRLCRSQGNMGTRCLTISDSMVSILCFSKGRSSSSGLNNLCRRAAAYQVGCNIGWSLRHIRTDKNPADAPSRRFGPDLPRNLGRRKQVETLGAVEGTDSFEQGDASFYPSEPRQKLDDTKEDKFFLELFAGTGRLTEAVRRNGLKVLPAFELANGREFNLLNPSIQSLVFGIVKSGRVWWLHLGTPCTAWSRARHGIKDHRRARKKEVQSVGTALLTARLIRLCLSRGIAVSLENPFSSRLWEFSPIHSLVVDSRMNFIFFDMCRYGMPYKKRTAILTSEIGFRALSRLCQGGHGHELLKGTTRAKIDGKWQHVNKTSLAGAYPSGLCDHWAQLARKIAPQTAFGRLQWHQKNEFLAALRDAAGSDEAIAPQTAFGSHHKDGEDQTLNSWATLQEASKYIKQCGVIFGQFTKEDIKKIREKEKGSCPVRAKDSSGAGWIGFEG